MLATSYFIFILFDILYCEETFYAFRATKWQSMLRISDSFIYPSQEKSDAYAARDYAFISVLLFYARVQLSKPEVLSVCTQYSSVGSQQSNSLLFNGLYIENGVCFGACCTRT